MHISSKLVEAGITVCDIDLLNEYREKETVIEDQLIETGGDHLDIEVRMLYTSGFFLKETKLSVHKKVTDCFFSEGVDHIKLFFFFKGVSRVREVPENNQYDNDIGFLRRRYLDPSGGGEMAELRGGDNTVRHIHIALSRDFFLHIIGRESWAGRDTFVQQILENKRTKGPGEKLPITPAMLNILQDILNQHQTWVNHRYYIELKIRELFFTIHEYQLNRHISLSTIKPMTYRTLESVKAYLTINFNNPLTINKLARRFLINEKTLKHDFKQCYGITIHAYVVQLKMEKARKMLLEEHTINDIAVEVGYLSVSHFIKTFKSYYGQTPKQIQKVPSSLPEKLPRHKKGNPIGF